MVAFEDRIYKPSNPEPESSTQLVRIEDLPHVQKSAFAGQHNLSQYEQSYFDGGKFLGGFGLTQLQIIDYPSLRARSQQLFTENLYARGLIRRLVTNEVGTGLTPEACPNELIIGVPEESLNDWTEDVESRFEIWGDLPEVCDWREMDTWGSLQQVGRLEAIVGGDVLQVIRVDRKTGLPRVQLIAGASVQSPTIPPNGKDIRHGVEVDSRGRHVAYWIRQEDGEIKRLAAVGRRSGLRIAKLLYGTDKRYDEVRGQPLLSIVLQSLKEIDRYRDAAARKAVINSILAMFIQKDEDKIGSLPLTGAATRKDSGTIQDSDGVSRKFDIAQQLPGMVIEELQQGEKPVGFGSQGTDINFPVFEEAMIQSVAWAQEMPPEILKLAFSSNYSASQAAILEFRIYLDKFWKSWGKNFCQPVFVRWLLHSIEVGKVKAPGLMEAWKDPKQYDVFGAWTSVDWYGSIKPSTKLIDQTKGSKMLVDNGWSTNARESRIMTGTKFSKNMKRLKQENALWVGANREKQEFLSEQNQKPQEPEEPQTIDE